MKLITTWKPFDDWSKWTDSNVIKDLNELIKSQLGSLNKAVILTLSCSRFETLAIKRDLDSDFFPFAGSWVISTDRENPFTMQPQWPEKRRRNQSPSYYQQHLDIKSNKNSLPHKLAVCDFFDSFIWIIIWTMPPECVACFVKSPLSRWVFVLKVPPDVFDENTHCVDVAAGIRHDMRNFPQRNQRQR